MSNLVIFYLIPYKKKCYITCSGKTDGLGAQTQAIYSALLYAAVHKISYCHTPLNEIAHNYSQDSSFSATAERFFSFSKGEKSIRDLNHNHLIINLDFITFLSIKLLIQYLFRSDMKVVFEKSHFHNYTNKISPKYTLIKKSLQDKFYTNQKPILVNHDSTVLNIAFHIRRGDVNQADIARFTDNERILSTLQTITYHLNQKEIAYKLSIYSQGKKEDFGNLSSLATLYLNGNVFEDFHHLVKADVLFMAKSSFSYSAALLSDGLIVYEPFWHPPLNEWLLYEDNERFINLLSEKIHTLHIKNINA